MIEKVKELVKELLGNDNSGHGMDHVMRVYKLSIKFAESEQADVEVVSLAALLHDVDDYKLFGEENAKNLTNAKRIMKQVEINDETKNRVLEIIRTMGYKKSLNGIRPNTIEGMIVSDADMCDVIGAYGILRVSDYARSKNIPFFDKNIFPNEEINHENYNVMKDSAMCHFFEKVLRLKSLMLTTSGKKEASSREKITIDFIKNIFIEEEAYEWVDYLDKFMNRFKEGE